MTSEQRRTHSHIKAEAVVILDKAIDDAVSATTEALSAISPFPDDFTDDDKKVAISALVANRAMERVLFCQDEKMLAIDTLRKTADAAKCPASVLYSGKAGCDNATKH